MDESWSRICLRWCQSLNLIPVTDLLSLTDGKFFHGFLLEYLNHPSPTGETTSDTFSRVSKLLQNEFPCGELVNIKKATEGHEDELVKLITLLIYLGTVKHQQSSLSSLLQNDNLFSKEVQHRFKCILQALMEQQATLTPLLLTEIIISRVSETTGQLAAPVIRARISSNSLPRVGKPSPGSPVIFASSPGQTASPLKDFLDSPATRQIAQYQMMLNERTSQTRELRTQLEVEKTEKQFATDENDRLKAHRARLEQEILQLKQEKREVVLAQEINTTQTGDFELREKYHKLVDEKRDNDKYLAGIEKQLEATNAEKEVLETRLNIMATKLTEATDVKHRVEMSMEDMRLNLNATQTENSSLALNIGQLQTQLDDILQQHFSGNSSVSSGRKSLAPSTLLQCDMTNVSLDCDDSVGMINGAPLSPGENMGDLVIPQLEERIETLQDNLEQCQSQLTAVRCEKAELEQDKARMEAELETRIEQLGVAGSEMGQLRAELSERNCELEALRTSEAEAKTVTAQLTSQLTVCQQDLEAANQRISEAKEVEVRLNSNLEAANQKLSEAKEVEERLSSNLEAANQRISEAKEVEVRLNSNLEAANQKLSEANEVEVRLTSSLETANQKLSEAKEVEERLSSNLEAANQKLSEVKEVEVRLNSDLEAANQRLNEAKIAEERLNSNLLTVENDNKAAADQQASQLAESRAEGEVLARRLEEKSAAILRKEEENDELVTKIKELSVHLDGLTEKMLNLEEELAGRKEETTQRDLSLQTLQQQLDKAESEKLEVEERLNQALVQEQERSKQLVQEAQEKLTQTEEKVRQTKEEADERVRQLSQEAEERVRQVSQEAEERVRQVSQEAEEKVRQVSQEAEERVRQVSQEAEERVSQVSQEAEKLAGEVKLEAEEKVRLVNEEAEKVRQEMVEKERQEAQEVGEKMTQERMEIEERMRQQTEEAQEAAEKVKQEAEEKLRHMAEDAERRESELAALAEVKAGLEAGQEAVQAEVKQLQEEAEEYIAQLQQEREKEAKWAQEVQETRNRIETMLLDCAEHVKEIEELRRLLAAKDESASAEKEETEEEVATLRAQMKELETKVELGLEELDKATDDNKANRITIESLEKERERIQGEKNELQQAYTGMETSSRATIQELEGRLAELESRLAELESGEQEASHKVEFLQSQLEDQETAADSLKEELLKSRESMELLSKDKASLETELSSTAASIEVLSKEKASLETELSSTKDFLVSAQEEIQQKNVEAEEVFNQMGALTEAKKSLEARAQELEDQRIKLEEANVQLTTEATQQSDAKTRTEQLESEHRTALEQLESEHRTALEQVEKMEREAQAAQLEREKLDQQCGEFMRNRETLAAQISQLITDTNEMKIQMGKQANKHEEHLRQKEETIGGLRIRVNTLEEVERRLEEALNKEEKDRALVEELEGQVSSLRSDLAAAEIKYTDLEQATSTKGSEDVKEALASQKKRYEERHHQVIGDLKESFRKKLNQMKDSFVQKISVQEKELKAAQEERKGLAEKVEQYVSKLAGLDEKLDMMQQEHDNEIEIIREKYTKSKEESIILKNKYDAAKDIIKASRTDNDKLEKEKENLSAELSSLTGQASFTETEATKREIVQLRLEKRKLTTQLLNAETKLREYTRRESGSRHSLAGGWSSGSLSGVPGRATRQSTSNLPDTDPQDSVFKLPNTAHTPGRAKAGRTVSDTRMGARRSRPPHGSGSLFSCEEEAGEMFSNSYLTDLKDGRCDITDNDDSRMSELSRRNTLCLPHLKSSYPVEHQFCQDRDITEDAVRTSQVKHGRESSVQKAAVSPAPSPVSNLTHQASNLSLESSPYNTRGRSTTRRATIAPAGGPRTVPKAIAFTVEGLVPGRAERRQTMAPSGTASRLTKQPCQGEHSAGQGVKQECQGKHAHNKKLDQSVILSPDYIFRPTRKRNSEQMLKPPLPAALTTATALAATTVAPAETNNVELDSSQDSDTSSLSRDSVRGSKRYKKEAGNVSYNKPGPPTPGRNKSLNKSKHENSLTSTDLALAADSTPSVTDTSGISTRSRQSLAKTPLLNVTNTPKGKGKAKSKMTPLSKVFSSAFRTRKYKLMKKQDESLGLKTTPLKAKEKASPKRKVVK